MASTDDLWAKFGSQILQTAAPNFDSKTQQFSLASSTLSLDLGNADPTIANAEIYNLGNTIPAASPSYGPGSSLITSYQLFLDAINLKGDTNPNLDSQINIAATAMNAAQTNFISVQQAAITAWTGFKAINPSISFYDYTTQQYTTYIQAKNDLDGKTSKWQGLMTQKYGAGYEVIANARTHLSATGGATDLSAKNAYNMAVTSGSVAAAGSVAALPGQSPQAAASALISSFAPSFSLPGFPSVYQTWQTASASGTTGASIHLTGDTAGASFNDSGWSASGEGAFSYGFFSLWAQNQTSSSSESTFAMSSDFDVQIDFVGLSSFVIAPGPWFDLGIIKAYKDQLLPGSSPFFTAGGSLARLPAQAVIGFQPTIKLKLSNSDYSSFTSAFKSETKGAMGIGPFVIGESSFSTYADSSSMKLDNDSGTITISPPPSTVPVLLGVISSRLDV